MWEYKKMLQFPVNIKSKDIKMAKYIVSQLGGPNGELGAAIRYLSQRYTMPTNEGKALLTDIGTEELSHVEIISAMIYQLLKGATVEELENAGLGAYYTDHGIGVWPQSAAGNDFSVSGISVTSDPISDLHENLAAEQKARATYEHLINLATDTDVIAPLEFLRQREILHYQRFAELLHKYEDAKKL